MTRLRHEGQFDKSSDWISVTQQSVQLATHVQTLIRVSLLRGHTKNLVPMMSVVVPCYVLCYVVCCVMCHIMLCPMSCAVLCAVLCHVLCCTVLCYFTCYVVLSFM